ncbi:hypothetical protein BDF20DRAFT_914598 [Mycotypha africana]|uniref:uncharacterized protein n=1 Tax=Mycotypha africana TaxID=64632 RepID=UPI002301ED4C|nr:uncharacterized protein BDF20DRAFT_914598 [Mycotypha africana]KAI8975734.1 hypothetical protein BDF20DRAFT_914598 [Mycotypha africana]
MSVKHLARNTPTDFFSPTCSKKFKNRNNNNNPSPFHTTSIVSYAMMPKESVNNQLDLYRSDKKTIAAESLDTLIADLESLLLDSSKAKPKNISPESDFKRKFLEDRIKHRKKIDEIIHESTTTYKDGFQQKLKKLLEKPKVPAVIPLTEEENLIVDKLFKGGQSGIIAEMRTARVTFKDIYKLYPETWLNDEIINFYFELLADRSGKTDNIPAIHCFNTFFYSTLRDSGYQKVRRWTKRVDVFAKDLLFVPINQSYHWILGVMDMKRKVVSVYDSLGGTHNHILDTFLSYLQEEHIDKKKTELDITEWRKEMPTNIPQQGNMSDCGAFTCTFAERLSRQMPFDFSQKDMTTIRRRIALNIAKKAIF